MPEPKLGAELCHPASAVPHFYLGTYPPNHGFHANRWLVVYFGRASGVGVVGREYWMVHNPKTHPKCWHVPRA